MANNVPEPPGRPFLKKHVGKVVFVGGMWCGDFLGRVLEIGEMHVEFAVEKALDCDSRVTAHKGERIALPYMHCMRLREPTDAQRQVTISEQAGEMEIR